MNIVMPLVQAGKARHYNAIPEYEGKSFVPIAIKVTASDPGDFTYKIKIWGAALSSDASH